MNLIEIIQKCKTQEELEKLILILLSEKEIYSFEERIKILLELSLGKTQRQVAENLNCSVVTVTRGAKVFNKNKEFLDEFLKIIP